MSSIFKNRKIKILSILAVVILALLGSFIIFKNQGEETKAADWFNENWYYRKSIEINNSTSTLTDFQVKILDGVDLSADINNGKIQPDLDDIRFTDKDGNLLDYWIEDKTATTTVNAWVKIPTLVSGTSTIYMYYGNPEAEDVSDGNSVFEFFDDFNDGNIASNWTIYGSGSWTESGGVLQVQAASNKDAIDTEISLSDNYITESRTRITSSQIADMCPSISKRYKFNYADNYNNSTNLYRYNSDYNESNNGRTNIQTGLINPTLVQNQWYKHKIIRSGSAIKAYFDASLAFDTTDNTYHEPHIGFWSYSGVTMQVDWVFVRKYEANEPTVSSLASEEQGPGPVMYLSFDEGHGSTAYDKTPYNNDGVITNATWKPASECKFGGCLYFDGDGDYVTVSSDESIDFSTDDFTVSFWFKPTVTPYNSGDPNYSATAAALIDKGTGSTKDGYGVWFTKDNTINFATDKNADSGYRSDLKTDNNYVLSDWYYVAVQRSGIYKKIYVNGVLVKTDSTQLSLSDELSDLNYDLYIGKHSVDTSYQITGSGWAKYFKGFIDEVKIYNYARTADQIKQDYNKGKSVSFGQNEYASLNNGLVGWWKMDESSWDGTAGEVIDSSGSGNNGTAQNGANVTSTAVFGRAGGFDGTTKYVETPLQGTIVDGDEYSFCSWNRFSDLSNPLTVMGSGISFFIIHRDTTYNSRYEARIWDGSTNPTDVRTVMASNYSDTTKWQHVCFIIDRNIDNKIYLYINGELKDSNTIPPGYGGVSFDTRIGGNTNSWYWNGQIDEVRVYNRALSPEEVRRLYEWAPGPVGWWKMDEHTGVSEVGDFSGNNLTTTMNNIEEADWTTGKFGSAIDFNNGDSNDYLSVSDTDILNFTSAMTLSVWVKPTDFSGNWNGIIFKMSTDTDPARNGYNIAINTSGYVQYWFGVDSGYNTDTSNSTVPLNKWTHIALTRDGDTVKIYFNGVLDKTTTYSNSTWRISNTVFKIGQGWGSTFDFNGKIDDVKLYDYARSPRQILEDMNAGRKNNPIAYWSFDEGQGTTVYDRGLTKEMIGTGYDGTLTNMSTSGTSTSWTKLGKKGGALDFDGKDEYNYVNLGTTDFGINSEFSLSFWMKYRSSISGNYIKSIFSKSSNSGNSAGDYTIGISDNKISYRVCNGTKTLKRSACGSYADDVGNILEANKWYHIVNTYDGSNFKTYVNGELVDSTIFEDFSLASNNYLIGTNYLNAHYWAFDGLLDEIKLYNYPLTLDEIRQNYNQGKQIVLSKSTEEVQQVTEGLVGWWKMDEGSWSGNSGEVIDYSGSGNNGTSTCSGTCTPPTTTSTARFGKAGEFDGVDDYVFLGDLDYVNTGKPNEFTISAWIYPRSNSGYQFVFGDEVSYNHGVMIQLKSGEVCDFYPTSYRCTGYYPTLNKWVYITLRQDENGVDFYVDGEFYSHVMDYLHEDTNYNSYIGMWNNGDSRAFKGLIDDVKVYNYARTPEQIMQDYVQGPPPVAYWKMDEKTGLSTVDSSGIGNDGTITGASWGSAADCKKGACLQFDGNDYVKVNNPFTADNFTISIFIKPTALKDGSYHAFIGAQGGDWSVRGPGMWVSPTGALHYDSYDIDGTTRYYGYLNNFFTEKNKWYHIVWVKDGTIYKFYKDNVLFATVSAPSRFYKSGTGYYIGKVDNYFKGYIDEVKIYNYALTPRQVAMEYNGGMPIAYYKFDKGEGGTAYDYSGNSNNGTIYPGTGGTNTSTSTMWNNGTNGKINGSLDFDGTDDYVVVSDNNYIDSDEDISLSAWIKPTSVSGERGIIGIGLSYYQKIFMEVNNGALDSTLNGNWSSRLTTGIIRSNTWQHVMAVVKKIDSSNSRIILYINGKEVGRADIDEVLGSTGDTKIGFRGGNYYFPGQIDEVKIWNYALTPEEVKKEYNGGFGIRFK